MEQGRADEREGERERERERCGAPVFHSLRDIVADVFILVQL
jgi:hypothetical protein